MAVFSLRFSSGGTEVTSFTEGQSNLGFIISWDGAVAAGTVISWEIIFAGRLPLTAADFDFSTNPQSGTLSVPVSDAAGESAVIPFTLVDDSISEPVQDLVVRLSIAPTNTNTEANIGSSGNTEPVDYTAPVADDDIADDGVDPPGSPYQLAGTVSPFGLAGDAKPNIFTMGETTAAIGGIGGAGGNDQYIITRYQTTNVSIVDGAGDDVVRFDFGVEIASAGRVGRTGAEIVLANGNRITLTRPTQERWSFQLGEGEAMSWANFLTAVNGASGNYIVETYLDSTILGEGGRTLSNLYAGSGSRDDVFTFGEDEPSTAEGFAGNDVYIISRFQNKNVRIVDADGYDIVKFDVGVSIESVTTSGRGAANGIITLTNGARITLTRPNQDRWKFQIADGELMSWAEFLAEIGSGGYAVPGLPNRAPTAADNIITITPSASHIFSADDFGYIDLDYNALAHIKIISLPNAGLLQLGGDTDHNADTTYSAVKAGQTILAADIAKLRYTPATSATADAGFDFKVNDGSLDSATANSITFNINAAPTAADNTLTLTPSASHAFSADDFGFSDADSDSLDHIKIISLPNAGLLQLGSDTDHDIDTTYIAVKAGQIISAADIGKLLFTSLATDIKGAGTYASFTFKVNDGTADSASENKMTFNINTPPIIANALVDYTQTIVKGAIHTYQLPSDSFTDADGDILTYKAAQLDSADNEIALPIGLSFDAATQTFTFTDELASSTYTIKVTATDGLVSVADEFDLRIVSSGSPISDMEGTQLDDGDLPSINSDII